MSLMIIIPIVIAILLVPVVVFGPYRSMDVLRAFAFTIGFFVLLPFRLASALYDWVTRKDTSSLFDLLVYVVAIVFSVPVLVLRFLGVMKEDDEAEDGQCAAIGDAVVLQTSWKEPPFAITVLGKPERIKGDRERLGLPVRYTGIIHRWTHSSVGTHPALMRTSGNDDGDWIQWEREYEEPESEDCILVEGGTYDRYIYFRAGDDEKITTVPRRRFVEICWLDGSETTVTIDLTKRIEPAERIRFQDGAPNPRLDKSELMPDCACSTASGRI